MSALDDLGRAVATAMDDDADEARHVDAVRQRLFAEAAPADDEARHRFRAVAIAGTLLAAAAAALFFVLAIPSDPMPIARLAGGQAVHAGMWLSPQPEGVVVTFVDGSEVEFGATARGRVLELSADRRSLALETGRIAVDVRPGSGATWVFEAGPFAVEVLGTAFVVDWDPQIQLLTVDVERGRVHVRGGALDEAGVRVGAGERIVADVPGQRTVLSRADTRVPLAVPPADLPSAEPPAPPLDDTADPRPPPPPIEADEPARPTKPRARPATPKAKPWRELAAAGDHAGALAAATAEGFNGVVARASAKDLALLAKAARHERDEARAVAALRSLRRRFPKSTAGRRAAFMLGRVAAELGKDPRAAAEWFRTDLEENPSGAMAGQSRGRLIQALSAAGETAAARTVAKDYLKHHPNGAYATIAKALVEGGRIE